MTVSHSVGADSRIILYSSMLLNRPSIISDGLPFGFGLIGRRNFMMLLLSRKPWWRRVRRERVIMFNWETYLASELHRTRYTAIPLTPMRLFSLSLSFCSSHCTAGKGKRRQFWLLFLNAMLCFAEAPKRSTGGRKIFHIEYVCEGTLTP